jgi:ribosomal protein S18 acetylase RimI-like enzyme
MKIRDAKVGDELQIAQVQFDAWKATYDGVMPITLIESMDIQIYEKNWTEALKIQGKGKYLVAEIEGKIIGFATFGPARDSDLSETESAELVALNVTPKYWRKKVGSALLDQVLALVGNKYKYIYLWVAEKNHQAISFYQPFGFSLEGSIKENESHGGIKELRYVAPLC